MDLLQALALALLQGLTEFLPISSAAHLILLPVLFGWPDQGLAFDVALHVGTLTAVTAYFWRELRSMAADWWRSLAGHGQTPDSRLAWAVLVGTVPVAVAGLVFHSAVEGYLRGPLVIATTTVAFGVLLGWADWSGARRRDEHSIGWKDVLAIGTAQALALIPGTSRSGITITAGLLLGLDRRAAARFSFLLSIPVIVLAGLYEARKLLQVGADAAHWDALLLAVAVSALCAYLTIHFFLKLVERIGLVPFVVYRLLLGAVLFAVFL